MKTSKSTGLSNMPARLLKDGSNVIAKPLTVLLNRTINDGSIPSEWKHAKVAPIHKAGSKSDFWNVQFTTWFIHFFKNSIYLPIS